MSLYKVPYSTERRVAVNKNPDLLTITNPKICEFYNLHPEYNFETVNLAVLDLLHSCSNSQNITFMPELSHLITYNTENGGAFLLNKTRCDELMQTYTNLKNATNEFNKQIIHFFITAKNEYINEFKTIIISDNANTFIRQNNDRLIEKIEGIIDVLKIHSVLNTYLHNKMDKLTQQFKQLIENNTSVIMHIINMPDKTDSINDFCMNFEINMSNLSITFQTTLTEYVNNKHDDVIKIVNGLMDTTPLSSINENIQTTTSEQNTNTFTTATIPDQDTTKYNAQYSRLLYELNNMICFMNMQTFSCNNSSAFELTLTQMYPTASISKMTETTNCIGYLLYREGKEVVYIENMYVHDRNVNAEELHNFSGKIAHHNANGICISYHTGIIGKSNFYIEIVNRRVVVYVHHLEQTPERIKMAMDILDSISGKLDELQHNNTTTPATTPATNTCSIPKEIMDNINREYQTYIMNKENMILFMKETHKKMLGQLDDIRFPSLDKFLATKYSPLKKQGYTCDLCHCFNVNTLKGLAAHKRGCIRKLGISSNTAPPTNSTTTIHLKKSENNEPTKPPIYNKKETTTSSFIIPTLHQTIEQ